MMNQQTDEIIDKQGSDQDQSQADTTPGNKNKAGNKQQSISEFFSGQPVQNQNKW